MFNSNLSLTVPPLLGIDGGVCTTPRTPEILNSLMAMTNPLEYSYQAATQANNNNSNGVASTNNHSVSQNSHDSHSNSSDSPLDSPAGHHGKTPSVQQTRSQLIKAGVKLLIQNKRKHSGCDSSDGNESSSGGGGCGGGGGGGTGAAGTGCSTGPRSRLAGGPQQKIRRDTDQQTSEDDIENHLNATSGCSSTGGIGGSPRSMLTPEDEDRRRRRRERNKIAATKCRMKKRERTVNLVNESETLDAQNKELKSQVSKLENERRKLIEVLQAHSSTCVHQKGYQPLPSLSTITNNNCKYLNDLNFLDSPNEIKYSECLKTGSEMGDYSKQDAVLPPGYCKLSPTEVTYGTPGDVMDVNSFTSQALKTEYIPSGHDQQQQQQPVAAPVRAKPGPKPRQRAAAAGMKRTVTSTSTTTVPDTTLPTVPVTLPSADFILKNELIDTSSPYTTVQSADRFLFENTLDLYNNNNNDSSTLDGHHTSDSDKLASLAVKDNASNALLELNASFDSSIFKASDYTLLAAQHTHLPHQQQQQQSQHQQQQQSQQHQHQCHLQQSLDLLTLQHQPLPSHHQMLSGQQSIGGSIVTNEYLILPEHDGSEFTDLDSGITSYTINGSCLA